MSDGRFPPGSRVTWAAPNEWPNEWREWWPECAMDADDAIADAEYPTFDVGTVVADDLQDGAVLVVWDGLGRCANDEDGDGMPYLYGWVVPAFALMKAP